jgi:hypothetical protein
VELPGTVVGIMADPEDWSAIFDYMPRRECRGVLCIAKGPVVHHLLRLANAISAELRLQIRRAALPRIGDDLH